MIYVILLIALLWAVFSISVWRAQQRVIAALRWSQRSPGNVPAVRSAKHYLQARTLKARIAKDCRRHQRGAGSLAMLNSRLLN